MDGETRAYFERLQQSHTELRAYFEQSHTELRAYFEQAHAELRAYVERRFDQLEGAVAHLRDTTAGHFEALEARINKRLDRDRW
jgi:hypothetical protein